MSASRADKHRYWLTFLLRNLPVGTQFSAEELHLTVITWFVTDELDDELVISSFHKTFSNLPAMTIRLGQEVALGEREVTANLVEPRAALVALHQTALDWFARIGGRWAVKNPYMGEDYLPHIRRRVGTKLRSGDKLSLTNFSLVRANRTEDRVRQVAARIDFNGKT